MKNLIKITTVLVLLTIGLSFFALGKVSIAENKQIDYEDGTYEIPLKVLKGKEKKESMMQKFIKEDEAFVTIQDGQAEVSFTLTHAHVIHSFSVNNGTENVEVDVLNEGKADDECTVLFKVANIATIIDAEVTIDVPIFPGKMTKDVRLQLDVSGLPSDSSDRR